MTKAITFLQVLLKLGSSLEPYCGRREGVLQKQTEKRWGLLRQGKNQLCFCFSIGDLRVLLLCSTIHQPHFPVTSGVNQANRFTYNWYKNGIQSALKLITCLINCVLSRLLTNKTCGWRGLNNVWRQIFCS